MLIDAALPSISAEEKKSANLSAPGVAKQVAAAIMEDIDSYCETAYDDGHRHHLGASLIGHNCSRYLWGTFRWLLREKLDGRAQRLFNRGHREEARFIEWLEGIGCEVYYEDRDSDPLYFVEESFKYFLASQLEKERDFVQELAILIQKKGIDKTTENYKRHILAAKAQGIEFKQYRISDINGHFGGSLDAIIILPARYGIAEPILGEFKTNGTGAGFNKLGSHGMPIAKPQHFSQTSVYGFKGVYETKFKWCLYLNINKNDDSIHCELVKLDEKRGEQMIIKAERIITSQIPPPRISDNPTFQDCSWCHLKDICHKGAIPEVNCRSCKHAYPVENAQWYCAIHTANIPKEYLATACPHYEAITQNV